MISDRRRQLSSFLLGSALALPLGRMARAAEADPGATDSAAPGVQPATDNGAPVLTRLSVPGLPAAAFSLEFDVYYGDYSGSGVEVASATYRFQKQGNRYRLDTEARASGVLAVFYSGTLVQVSEGVMDAQGFVPARYSEKRGRRPERRYRFDSLSRHIRQEGDPAIDFAYPDGTQDRLTIFFQLGLLARADARRFRPGQKFVLPLAGSRRIDEPFFRVVSQERMRTNAGEFDALHISVEKPGDQDAPRFDIWLAPELKMLPVRIRVFDHGGGGKIVDQVLRRRPQEIR